MSARRGWLLWFFGLGCYAFLTPDADGDPPAARGLWQQGQDAMRQGQAQRAIGFYEQSLAADPAFTRCHMSLAAAYLESGRDEAACVHLGKYLAAHPEHVLMHAHHAELLLRLHRGREARRAFERFTADAQDAGAQFTRHLVHAHTRLMEIAEGEEDEYGIRLHRGLGLYWLARERTTLKDADGELPAEGLLFRAARELDRAHRERPGAARPCWYLYAVWSQLAQKQLALRWLRRAAAAAPFTDLTPAEIRSLDLACRAAADPLARR
jgi:tetratricopeptide (TPR) repeat protein